MARTDETKDLNKKFDQLEKINQSNQEDIKWLKDRVKQLELENERQQAEIYEKLANSIKRRHLIYDSCLIALMISLVFNLAYTFSIAFNQATQFVPNFTFDGAITPWYEVHLQFWDRIMDWNALQGFINSTKREFFKF